MEAPPVVAEAPPVVAEAPTVVEPPAAPTLAVVPAPNLTEVPPLAEAPPAADAPGEGTAMLEPSQLNPEMREMLDVLYRKARAQLEQEGS